MQADVDKLILAGDVPAVPELAEEFFRCMNYGGLAWRRRQNDDARFCRWPGQSDDGRKWDANLEGKAMPWDGASDTRIALADDVINDNTALLSLSFWRAIVRTMAVEVGDVEQSAWTSRLLEWLISSRLYQGLLSEVELSAQYGQQYGWCVIHAGWERELSRRRVDVSLDQLVGMLAQQSGAAVPAVMELLTNEALSKDAAAALRAIYFSFARSQVSADDVDDDELPELSESKARKLLKSLRESGAGDLVVPFQVKNQPVVYALKPWSEFFMPPETCELQRAPRLFWLDYMTPVELEASALESGWNGDWIEAAMKMRGQSFTRYNKSWMVLNQTPVQLQNDLIEVVHCYQRQIDEEGVPGITYTVFHPGVTRDAKGNALFGRSELLGDASCKYPFAIYRRERPTRQLVETRGVPDVAAFWQQELKKQRDSLWDLTDLTTIPPISGPPTKGAKPRLGPAAYVPRAYDGDYKFMDLPQRVPAVALELIREIKNDADDYFGRGRVNGDPDRVAMKRQMMVNSFLGAWSEVLSLSIGQCQQYLTDAQMARLTNGAYAFPKDAESISGQFDTIMRLDAKELSSDAVSKSLELIAKYIVPMDATGELDRGVLTRLLTLAVGPDIYRALQSDKTSGSRKTVKEVKSDLANILLGIEPDYIENDPQAKFKLRVLQDLTANSPTVASLLQGNPQAAELFKKYNDALSFAGTQQDNAAIGRLGVAPGPEGGMGGGQEEPQR